MGYLTFYFRTERLEYQQKQTENRESEKNISTLILLSPFDKDTGLVDGNGQR